MLYAECLLNNGNLHYVEAERMTEDLFISLDCKSVEFRELELCRVCNGEPAMRGMNVCFECHRFIRELNVQPTDGGEND